ncbi:hypothetical protein [Halomicrococcus sp. NG-SE-24]|uniref:hypothetical protein n=1 Tax=Halomicrococcus sp. NG-SE-24 TaxID=3436928 RepID=UPI003D969CC8
MSPIASTAATGVGATFAGGGRQLFVRDDGHERIVESVDEVSLHIRWQIVDRFERVVQASVHCVERSHTLIGVFDLVVATPEFRDVGAASMLCACDVFEPAHEVVPPVVSQLILCGVRVGARLLPGVEVSDGVGTLRNRLSGVYLRLQPCLEMVLTAIVRIGGRTRVLVELVGDKAGVRLAGVLFAALLLSVCNAISEVETVGIDEVVDRLLWEDAVLVGL